MRHFQPLPDYGTNMKTHHLPLSPLQTVLWQTSRRPRWTDYRTLCACLVLALCAGSVAQAAEPVAAADHAAKPVSTTKTAAKKTEAVSAADAPELAIDIKKALREQMLGRKKLSLVISDLPEAPAASKSKVMPKEVAAHASLGAPATHAEAPAVAHPVAVAARPRPVQHAPVVNPRASRDYIQAKAAALTGHEATAMIDAHGPSAHGDVHWSYTGETGPQAWGKLKPEFSACATGKRQSPINIEESFTLQGPAEPLQFDYTPANGTVVNNGHTIQVDMQGSNTLTVRGSTYSLLQIHFHSPSEEQVNYRHYAMVAHLVHKNAEGQLAVVAVLLDPGAANPLIDKIWTYMPLDVTDQVRMPAELVNLNELLPKDQRYYQFIGSLTTPPCTEGVLWMVLKQPTQISKEQLKLFQQLYPRNARPVQPVNNRPVRNAQ